MRRVGGGEERGCGEIDDLDEIDALGLLPVDFGLRGAGRGERRSREQPTGLAKQRGGRRGRQVGLTTGLAGAIWRNPVTPLASIAGRLVSGLAVLRLWACISLKPGTT